MDEQFMRKKAVLPLITSMALPMVLSMLVNALYNIVDSYFVARISENAMTALSLVYPLQNLVNAIAIGFGVGISAVIALYLGAGKQKRADQAATQGMLYGDIGVRLHRRRHPRGELLPIHGQGTAGRHSALPRNGHRQRAKPSHLLLEQPRRTFQPGGL